MLGASGQVGREVVLLARNSAAEISAPSSTELNIGDSEQLETWVRSNALNLVINCAAYTNVEQAESDLETATQINAGALQSLADLSNQYGFAIAHVSTDYVFNGNKQGAYVEEDDTYPLNVYGKTKLAGEEALRNSSAHHCVLRASWVFSENGNNFLKSILRKAGSEGQFSVVNDQWGCPCSARFVATSLWTLSNRLVTGDLAHNLYHLGSEPVVSWWQFAQEILAQAFARRLIQKLPILEPVSSRQFATLAQRPQNSNLSMRRLSEELALSQSDWKKEVAEVLGRLAISDPISDKDN